MPAARQNPRDAKRYKENVLQANWDWEKKKKEEGVWFYRGSFEHLFFWGPHPPDLGISSKVAASAKRARKMKAAPTSTVLLANHGVCFPIYYLLFTPIFYDVRDAHPHIDTLTACSTYASTSKYYEIASDRVDLLSTHGILTWIRTKMQLQLILNRQRLIANVHMRRYCTLSWSKGPL